MALTDFNVYLETNYGLDYTLGTSKLSDLYATVDLAAVDFPWWCAYCTCDSARCGLGVADRVPTAGAPAWTDPQILDCSVAVAAHNDAVWATGGAIGQDWYFGALPLSRANIIWPHGSYYINYPLILNYGQYTGQGSGNSAPDLNSPLSQVCGGTRLSIWHEEWLDIAGGDNGPVKHIMQSLNWPVAVGGTVYAGVLGALPWATVSGGGTSAANGSYIYVDIFNTKARFDHYNGIYRLYWTGAAWHLINIGTAAILYSCPDNVDFPWLTTTAWTVVTGTGPAPTMGQYNSVMDLYMEGCIVQGFRFNGRKADAPEAVDSGNTYVVTYEDAGVALLRGGSVSEVSRCLADEFNNAGFCFGSGVPATCFNLRAFDCNYASIWLRGDGTFTFTGVECDECPTVFKAEGFMDPTDPISYLITPGATLTVNGTKIETGTSGVSTRYKGTMFFDGVGWCIATFNGVGYASSNIYPELLCRVEPYPTDFTSTESYVSLTGLKTFGYFRTLMHHADGTDSKKWFLDKGEATLKYNSTIHGFVYNSANNGTLTVDSGQNTQLKEINYTNRQDWLFPAEFPSSPGWNDAVNPGTPIYTNPAS